MAPVVRVASRDDVPAIAVLLASTLSDDSFFRLLLPSEPSPPAGAVRFFEAYALTHLGRDRALEVACGADGRIVGVAAWTYRPEGRGSLLSRQTGRSVRYVRSLGPRRTVLALRLRHELEHRRPHGTHWWLSAIAVAREERREGVGSALLAHRLDVIDTTREAAYVEATSAPAQALCSRFDFLAHNTPGKTPTYELQSMSREPRRPLRRYD